MCFVLHLCIKGSKVWNSLHVPTDINTSKSYDFVTNFLLSLKVKEF